jgi:hypothetical protein
MFQTSESWTKTYDRLLRYQADLSADIEMVFFRQTNHWLSAQNILDFGSGNSYYARILSNKFPSKQFTCIDKNPSLASIGKDIWDHAKMATLTGTFHDLNPQSPFDFIYSRHVLSYLEAKERQSFIRWASMNTTNNSAILVIDADDDEFFCFPKLPFLESGNERFKDELKAKGGDRSLRNGIEDDFRQQGFRLKSTVPLIIHSDIASRKYLLSMFMCAVAEIDHGTPLPHPVREEIDSWANDSNSYLQYGLFGSLYERVA